MPDDIDKPKRYYLDTEFIEAGPEHPLQLISIGIACDDGRTFYAESREYNASLANDFVRANVLPKLTGPVFRRDDIRAMAEAFMRPTAGEPNPEVYGYYADYDWVIFAQLFGCMVDLPKWMPYYCRDLKQIMDDTPGFKKPDDPKDEHHALADAKWNMALHTALEDALPALLARVETAEKIVAKLPVTADGAPIVLGQNLYARVKMNEDPAAYAVVPCGFITMNSDGGTVRDGDGCEYEVDASDCYSTPEAAAIASSPAKDEANEKEK